MNFTQPSIDFDLTPDAATIAVVDEVSTREGRCEADYVRFEAACRAVAVGCVVDPNKVRDYLDGAIESRRLSSFWLRATGKRGFLDNSEHWIRNTDTRGRNAGRPIRERLLRSNA